MTRNPLISVITPTYNRANYLHEAIDSVLNQSYSNFEHLIIDDGSTDNTEELVACYLNSQKVRYFYQENQGQSVARNKGVTQAKGEFICFLDSDDRWKLHKLKASLAAFEQHPEVDVVYGDYEFIDQHGKKLKLKNMPRYSGRISKELIKDNCVSMNTTMVRAKTVKAIGGFSSHVKVADDYDLWLRLSAKSKFLYLPEVLADYRVMKNQISYDTKRRLDSNTEIITRFLESNPDLLSATEQKEALNFFYTRSARHCSGTREFKLANTYFSKALGKKLLSLRTWRALLRHLANLVC